MFTKRIRADEFDTNVTKEFTTQIAQEIEAIVRTFWRAIADDTLIEELLHYPSRVLREAISDE